MGEWCSCCTGKMVIVYNMHQFCQSTIRGFPGRLIVSIFVVYANRLLEVVCILGIHDIYDFVVFTSIAYAMADMADGVARFPVCFVGRVYVFCLLIRDFLSVCFWI